MLSVNINEILVSTKDIEEIVERSIYNFIQENELRGCDNHFSLDNVDVFKRQNDSFEIVFRGTHGEDGSDIEDFKFSLAVPHNFNMDKVVKRFWNKIVAEAKLESKGFKKVEVDYTDYL